MMDIKLEIKNLSKMYSNENSLQVLNGLNLTVANGEFLSIVGVSGSGKSTLLRLIAGFELPDSGVICLDGETVTKPSMKRVMIFQDFNQLFPWKTVLENVLFPLAARQIGTPAEQRDRALKFLKMVRLEGFENYYPYQLSGGMKQKAAIARALVLEPNLLLMDEPFSSLDAQTRRMLQESLLDVWKDTKVTILFVTHDIQEAVLLSDRIAVLDKTSRTIIRMIDNRLPRPRKIGSPQCSSQWEAIYQLLGEQMVPEPDR